MSRRLSPDELAALVREVIPHASEPNRAYAVAIALAESATVGAGPSPTGDWGPWQINHAAHPSYDTNKLDTDPLYNARAMAAISSGGTNWRPWSTAWERPPTRTSAGVGYLGPNAPVTRQMVLAQPAVHAKGIGIGDIPEVAGAIIDDPAGAAGFAAGVLNPLDALGDFLGVLTSWATWRRVLYVLAGVIAIGGGLALLGADLTAVLPSPPAVPAPE